MNVAEFPRSVPLPLPQECPGTTRPREDLIAEIKERWAQGDPVDVRELLARDPTLWMDQSIVLDLAYEEYCLRLEAGESPDHDAYCARFPNYRNSLRDLLDAHGLCQQSQEAKRDEERTPWPKLGDTFGGYVVLRELGRGACSRVYLAVEPRVGNRQVAVKLARRGAITEAEAVGKLSHPHIVPIYSVRNEPDVAATVFCMPYLGSATLWDVQDQLFAAGKPPVRGRAILEAIWERTHAGEAIPGLQTPDPAFETGTYVDAVVHLGVQLAEALAHVHAMGIYHRDLKLSNVLLSPDGRPWLLDFNLAYDAHTDEAYFGGTPTSMAPEQLAAMDPARKGDRKHVDARSDVFSLGVILHELLTGRHPFGSLPTGPPSEEMLRDLHESRRRGFLPIRQANPHVDRPLAQILERCLAFDPAERPQSAAVLADALRKSLTWPHRLRRWARNHRPIVFAAVLLMVFGGFAGGAAWYGSDPHVVRQYKHGVAAYREGRYPEAEDYFTAVLSEDKHNHEAFFWRAQARKERGEFEAAFQDLIEVQRLHPDGRTRACLAYCLSKSQHPLYHKIRDHYRAAIEAGYPTPEVYNNLGYCCVRLGPGRYLEALDMLNCAIDADPSLSVAYQNRANLRFQMWCNRVKTEAINPGKLSQSEILLPASADMEAALARGIPTAALHADAARIYAVLAYNADDQHVNQFVTHLREAIQGGETDLPKDPLVARELRKLALVHLLPSETPALHSSPVPAVYTVDLIKDLP